MALQDLLDLAKKDFQKKNPDSETEFIMAADAKNPNGLILNNPLLEYILDRRFLAYGRFYLVYGKKSSSKTSFFYYLAKTIQEAGGDVVWLETENAIDPDFARSQGVDLDKMLLIHPQSLEEALDIAEKFIRNMPKAYPDGKTPVLICLDSIAGSVTEYEMEEKHSVADVTPGAHARLLSRWYREMQYPLAQENCIFLALNQQKEKIGAMAWGEEGAESMIGGNAPLFHSTYQLKMVRTKDIVAEDEAGAERKVGSKHKLTCKRNKLGREGNSQAIEFDLWIKGGIDMWCPLVDMLADGYTSIVSGSGWYTWKVPDIETTLNVATGEKGIINVAEKYRKEDLAKLIKNSPQAIEVIRKAFNIPPLPSETEIAEVETERLTKRKKKQTLA